MKKGMRVHTVPIQQIRCKNCNSLIKDKNQYCSYCGAKQIKNRLTYRNLTEDFAQRFLNLENTFLKTFLALFTKPEHVIDGYIQGIRKRYVSAFNYFAISITFAGLYIFILNEFFIDSYFETLSLQETAQDKFTADFSRSMVNGINEYQGLLSFLSIPFLALISRIVFWNYNQYNYIEHMVIYLYVFSHANLITYIVSILFLWSPSMGLIISIGSLIFMVAYIAYALKRLYHLDAYKFVLKTVLFMIISGILSFVISVVVGVVMYKLGYFEALVEASK